MALDRINATALLDGGVTSADLATQTGNVDFADNARIRLGNSQDLQLYHDGSNSFLDDAGAGNVFLRGSSQVIIANMTGEQAAVFNDNGAVTLNYDNAQKLATSATGADVTGTVFSSDGQFGLDSTDYMQFVDNSHVRFITNGAEKMRLESGGHLMVGTTDTNPANNGGAGNPGIAISPDGVYRAARTGNVSLDINRMGSDGQIAAFRRDGNTVGDIGVNNSDNLRIQGNSSHSGIEFGTNAIFPHKNASNVDATIDLGESSLRWKDLYLSGGVVFGTGGPSPITSNTLDDYEEGGWTPNIGGNASYNNSQGTYTKIGNSVCAAFDITINAIGTGANNTMYGFPFTAALGALGVNSGHISFYSGIATTVYSVDCYIVANQAYIHFTGHTTASVNIANVIPVFQNGTRILGTVHYQAN